MEEIIKVGMADLKASRHPSVLTTLGLGSCVGISLYDPVKKIIGMAHIMLPLSTQAKNNSNIAKFADTAVEKLLDDMVKLGAVGGSIVAKLAGGAQMFAFNTSLEMLRIGARNVLAVKEKLNELNIRLVAEDTGGNYGRTIELYSRDGRLVVKTIGYGTKVI